MRRAVALCTVALVAGCGDDGAPAPRGGPLDRGASLQAATCRDWRAASPAQRSNTVDRLEEVAAGPRGEGGTLPDELAYSTLEARCGLELAQGFLLYELYNRAAGFRSLSE